MDRMSYAAHEGLKEGRRTPAADELASARAVQQRVLQQRAAAEHVARIKMRLLAALLVVNAFVWAPVLLRGVAA